MTALAHRRTAWIAIFAVLLNAFVPLLSQARAPVSGPPGEVCTAAGAVAPRYIDSGDDTHEAKPHCPYCVPHGAGHGWLPSSAVVFEAPYGTDAVPAAAVAPLARRVGWLTAHPRAPPSLI